MNTSFLTDSHAHLTSDEVFPTVDAVLERAQTAGVRKIVNICTDVATLERGIALAKKYPWVYNTASTTPHDVQTEGESFFPIVRHHALAGDLVAMGETGLDYHYTHSPHDIQRDFLRRYLHLALESSLPVVIHCREAFTDFFEILDREFVVDNKLQKGVLHCFTGTVAEAEQVLHRNWFLSISGIATFKKSEILREVIRIAPLEQLLIETDTPFLAPQSHRGQQNEPAFLPETASLIAQIKGITPEVVATQTSSNAASLFARLVVMLLLFLCPCQATAAQNPEAMLVNELARLDTLISATEQTLETEKKVRAYLVEYTRIQELFLLAPNDNDLLMKMARSAHRTLQAIQEAHLEQTFDPEFINELKVLSKAAQKRGIPKP